MATFLWQAWSHRWLGTATLDWADDAGAHSVSASGSSVGTSGAAGLFSHVALTAIDPKDRSGSTLNLGFPAFAPYLQTTMDAATAQTPTCVFDQATGLYTLACNGAVFSLTLTGTTARDIMRRILGFSGNKSGATSYTSDTRPFYSIRTAVDAKTGFRAPSMISEETHWRRASEVAYSLSSTRPTRSTQWEHRHEAKAAVQRRFAVADTVVGGASWTYEDFLEHAASFAVPCVVKDGTESMVFFAPDGFVESAIAYARPDYDGNETVRIRAATVAGYL